MAPTGAPASALGAMRTYQMVMVAVAVCPIWGVVDREEVVEGEGRSTTLRLDTGELL